MPIDHPKVGSKFIEQCQCDVEAGVIEAIDREVARRRREGLPIHVWQDGKVVDLQKQEWGGSD